MHLLKVTAFPIKKKKVWGQTQKEDFVQLLCSMRGLPQQQESSSQPLSSDNIDKYD